MGVGDLKGSRRKSKLCKVGVHTTGTCVASGVAELCRHAGNFLKFF